MEEQKHSVNDSEMGNPSILSVLVMFVIHISMYIFIIEWKINKQTNKQTNRNNVFLFIQSKFNDKLCIELIIHVSKLCLVF